MVPDNPAPGMDHQTVPRESAGVHPVRDGTIEEDLARLRTQLVIHPDEVPDQWKWFIDFNPRVFDDTQ